MSDRESRLRCRLRLENDKGVIFSKNLFKNPAFSAGMPDCVFSKKFPIWVNIGGPCNGRCWVYFMTFGLF
jgi:hypothetical protein